jgi:type IV secretion system protein VirD4
MDLDEVILVVDAQMPIRARRVKYFEDPTLKVLHVGQAGSFPYPDEDRLRRDRQMSETRETFEKLRQELNEVRASGTSQDNATSAASPQTAVKVDEPQALEKSSRGRAARAGVAARPGRLNLDLGPLGISEKDRTALASAVQTTRSIIEEHT